MLKSLTRIVLVLAVVAFAVLTATTVLVMAVVLAVPEARQELGLAPSLAGLGLEVVVVWILAPVMLFAILLCMAMLAWRVCRSDDIRKGEAEGAEQMETMQQLYQGLSRLEERVEALETILLTGAGRPPRDRETR